MLRLLVVWTIVLVVGSMILSRNGGGFGEMVLTWGFFLSIPALIILWLLSQIERLGANWFENMPMVVGLGVAALIPIGCAAFYRQQMGWDVILQAVVPISAVLGLAWAFSPRMIG